jgi:hypothetical protein
MPSHRLIVCTSRIFVRVQTTQPHRGYPDLRQRTHEKTWERRNFGFSSNDGLSRREKEKSLLRLVLAHALRTRKNSPCSEGRAGSMSVLQPRPDARHHFPEDFANVMIRKSFLVVPDQTSLLTERTLDQRAPAHR